jgi:hypothetical protein
MRAKCNGAAKSAVVAKIRCHSVVRNLNVEYKERSFPPRSMDPFLFAALASLAV